MKILAIITLLLAVSGCESPAEKQRKISIACYNDAANRAPTGSVMWEHYRAAYYQNCLDYYQAGLEAK